MLKILVLGVGLTLPAVSLACGGTKGALASTTVSLSAAPGSIADKDATACAKKAHLVGANCSYTTGMMAQRVLAEGTPWNYTGRISESDNNLESHVAAPFTVGPEGKVNVVATEIFEALIDDDLQ
ncbi:MAG: hypothetical protein JRI25_10375, partial [Deltaproteobacteria bacterium]|nr:hypothetical protein [Deltaproteobacteria bacterium]